MSGTVETDAQLNTEAADGAIGSYTLAKLRNIIASETAHIAAAVAAGQVNAALTGNPTAPTPAPGDSDQSIATTAFSTAQEAVSMPLAATTQLYGGTGVAGTAAVVTVGTNLTLSGGTISATSTAVSPATVAPLIDGIAAVGTSLLYTRQDHAHPTDTSRAATFTAGTNLSFSGSTLNATGGSGSIYFNVKTYGAIGDGSSHPASGSYANLAAVQAVYSFATATTNEMDWLGCQAAVNAATAHLNGGRVYAPAGTYTFDKPLIFPIGVVDFFTPGGAVVDMVGDGMGATIFQPKADFGASSAVISCGLPAAIWSDNTNTGSGRYTNMGCSFGLWQDFTVRNSLGINIAVGSPVSVSGTAVAMDGICWAARRQMRRICSEGFRAGVNAVGDHTTWENCYFQNNTYGVYMASSSVYLQGDLTWRDCMISGNTQAGIFVSKNTSLDVHCSGELYTGGQPYSILGEAGTPDNYGQPYGGTSQVPMISNMIIETFQAELQGNAVIWDDNITNTGGTLNAGTRTIQGLEIQALYTSYGASSEWATGGRGLYAWIAAQYANGIKITNIYPGSMTAQPGMKAGLIFAGGVGYSGGGLILSGDMTNTVNGYGTLGIELVKTASGDATSRYIRVEYPGVWEGGVIQTTSGSTTAWAKGNPVEFNNYAQVQLSGGTNPVFGINMQPWSSGPAGRNTVYADFGSVPVVITGTNTQNSLVMAAASGGATVAASYASGPIIGINTWSSAPAIVKLRLS